MPEIRAALSGTAAVAELTARSVHAYYTARLAEALAAKLSLAEPQPGSAVFAAG
jgi:hypothetical protein